MFDWLLTLNNVLDLFCTERLYSVYSLQYWQLCQWRTTDYNVVCIEIIMYPFRLLLNGNKTCQEKTMYHFVCVRSLSFTHTHTQAHKHAHTHTHTHTHTHKHACTHTHTHKHTLSLCLSSLRIPIQKLQYICQLHVLHKCSHLNSIQFKNCIVHKTLQALIDK